CRPPPVPGEAPRRGTCRPDPAAGPRHLGEGKGSKEGSDSGHAQHEVSPPPSRSEPVPCGGPGGAPDHGAPPKQGVHRAGQGEKDPQERPERGEVVWSKPPAEKRVESVGQERGERPAGCIEERSPQITVADGDSSASLRIAS